MDKKVRTIIIDGVEIQTSLSAVEIADLPLKNADLQQRIDKAIDDIDLVIELIKQQPTEDDNWILNRLNGFKYILKGDATNE